MNFKTVYKISLFCLLFMIGCQTSKPILFVSKPPIPIELPYYQSWVSGIQGGGSGIDVFLPVKNLEGITPDSLFFRGQGTKATYNNQYIVGHFRTSHNQSEDVILSHELLAETNNKLLPVENSVLFELDEKACVLSYFHQNRRYFYKISNLTERTIVPYP